MRRTYHCVLQQDITDCGAACIATVSRQYGLKLPISKIRAMAGTDKQGTNIAGIVKAATSLGFSTKAVRAPSNEIIHEQFPLPAIAHVVVNDSLQHYVVVHKITKKYILLADPSEGLIKLSLKEFLGEGENSRTKHYRWTGILVFLVPTTDFKPGEQTTNFYIQFLKLLIPQKKLVLHIFIASIMHTLFGILGAFYFMFLIDGILPSGLESTLHVFSIGVIVLNLFIVLLSAFRSHLLLHLSQKLDISLLLSYYSHVLSLPMDFFGTRKTGEIISRFNDAANVRQAISNATLTIMIDVLLIIVGGIILFNQNSDMFMVSLGIVFLYLVVVLTFNKAYSSSNKVVMENNAQLTSYFVESLNGIQTIKAFNAECEANLATELKFITLLRSVFKLYCINNFQETIKWAIQLIGGVIILWVGASNVINGSMTIGQLISFNALLAYFLHPIRNLIDLQPIIHTAVIAANRLGEILEIESEVQDVEKNKLSPDNLKGNIDLKGITFRYGTRKEVLKNISISIKQGQKVAFVGESGSGKTTIAKLLLNLYQSEAGDIFINGVNIKDIRLDILREKIAYTNLKTNHPEYVILDI